LPCRNARVHFESSQETIYFVTQNLKGVSLGDKPKIEVRKTLYPFMKPYCPCNGRWGFFICYLFLLSL